MTDGRAKNGGARPGSGPKPKYANGGKAPKTSLSLDPISIALAKALGEGNMSEGVRKAVRMCCQARMRKTTKQDMMLCGLCGVSWDLDGPAPPCGGQGAISHSEYKDRGGK